ncbi:hypothetical protein QE152_g346 [Popillia japonica]|uniref:Uncharacterized protein n=1 Tax=Popillia japonica TaxID=7064 RepID=A0AAW1NKQ0_POPJA
MRGIRTVIPPKLVSEDVGFSSDPTKMGLTFTTSFHSKMLPPPSVLIDFFPKKSKKFWVPSKLASEDGGLTSGQAKIGLRSKPLLHFFTAKS